MDDLASLQNFTTDSTSSVQSDAPPKTISKKEKELIANKDVVDHDESPKCSNIITSTSTSSSTTISIGAFNSDTQFQRASGHEPPHIGYELSVAKSILQQYSTLSGDNL